MEKAVIQRYRHDAAPRRKWRYRDIHCYRSIRGHGASPLCIDRVYSITWRPIRPSQYLQFNDIAKTQDAYTVDGVERTTPRAKREARLVKAIRDARKYHEERLTIVYMYYDVVTDGKGRATPVIHGRTEYIEAFKSSCGYVVY